MELDTVAKVLHAFYRLCGTDEDDPYLTDQGEATNEVAYTYLTRGCREAQRSMLDMGHSGWRKRTAALTWSTDSVTGEQYVALPSDFLRAFGDHKRSALRDADGDQWGWENENGEFEYGNFYYFRDYELRLGRRASPPSTLYLEYHYSHPLWNDSTTIDFPMDARWLIIAEAANTAKEENWLPGGPDMEVKIARALIHARQLARSVARVSKRPRQFRAPTRVGNRW